MAPLNESKYRHDIHGNIICLALFRPPAADKLKSVLVPDPLADGGRPTIRYSLVPHFGNWKEALVHRRAMVWG